MSAIYFCASWKHFSLALLLYYFHSSWPDLSNLFLRRKLEKFVHFSSGSFIFFSLLSHTNHWFIYLFHGKSFSLFCCQFRLKLQNCFRLLTQTIFKYLQQLFFKHFFRLGRSTKFSNFLYEIPVFRQNIFIPSRSMGHICKCKRFFWTLRNSFFP